MTPKTIMTLRQVKAKYGLAAAEYITVCSSCLQASCWQGHLYCEDYETANIVARTVRDLLKMAREHPSFWVHSRAKP